MSVKLTDRLNDELEKYQDVHDLDTSSALRQLVSHGLVREGYLHGVTVGDDEAGTLLSDFSLEGARMFGYGAVALFWAAEQFDIAAGFAMVAMVMLAIQQRATEVVRAVDWLTLGKLELVDEVDA